MTMKNVIIVIITALTIVAHTSNVNPDIVFKYTDAYEFIWNDAGSEGNRHGSIWRAKNYQSEYCSLGDVAVNNYNFPNTKSVLVTAKKSGALVHPTYFSKVWDDRASGAYRDCAVYRMHAPSGYTCLGGVAMGHHSMHPHTSKYCCVKNDYVVSGNVIVVYNDKGTGARSDLSLWTVVRSNAFGIYSGNFIAVNGYWSPSGAYLLKEDGIQVRNVWSLPIQELKPLYLYEMSDVKMIWNDAGSGAYADCSIWRAEVPKGYYSIGDVAVATHRQIKIAYAIKPTDENDDALRVPVSYNQIWSDSGSGAYRDVKIWKANCPGGYVALGNVATSWAQPEIGSIYCVKYEYTTYGNGWQYVWRDHGSGASQDVTIWEAIPSSSFLQTVRGMGAIASHSGYPGNPYFLNKNFFTYWAEKPISKIILSNVKYQLDNEKQITNPLKLTSIIVENLSDIKQKSVKTLTYSVEKSSTFTFSQAIQLGVTAEFSANIPLIGGFKTTVSLHTTSTFETGSTTTTSESHSIEAHVESPANSQQTVYISATEYMADIPYTANIKKIYYDGSYSFGVTNGVYKGVAISEARIKYGEIEYFQV